MACYVDLYYRVVCREAVTCTHLGLVEVLEVKNGIPDSNLVFLSNRLICGNKINYANGARALLCVWRNSLAFLAKSAVVKRMFVNKGRVIVLRNLRREGRNLVCTCAGLCLRRRRAVL